MSIYKQNIDPIALTESDADEFLRDMDITLYEDTIMIEGTEFEGTYGEEILAENGIFLYEDCIVLEGEAAKKITKQDYMSRKAKEREEEAKKYDKYDNKGYKRNITPKKLMGSRANKHVGDKASLKQLSFNKGSFKNHDNTRAEDHIRRKYAEDIVERDRLNRDGSYSGKGMTIKRDKKGNNTAYSVDRRYDKYNKNSYYSDEFCDEEKDKRIAHNAARDAANRHLRRHSKYVKESTIFSDIEII